MDFTNLKKACLKDSYPLLQIDILVDSTARHQLLSFMDAFSSYNQIKLAKVDQEKTSFVTKGSLLLQSNVIWTQEYEGHVSEADEQDVRTSD